MLMTYPALFYFDPDESVPYFVHFPDFPNSATQGKTISDAMMMASDYLASPLRICCNKHTLCQHQQTSINSH